MNEKSNKRPVLVGLFIFIGLLFLISGILIIGNLHETFQQKIKIVAVFNDVEGIQAGNNIWFSGVKIGTVSSVHFLSRTNVRVELRIETASQEYIRKDAKVKIGTDGLIGNKILVIYGGTTKGGAVDEGDTLKVETTLSSQDIMNTLQENNRNLLSITSDIKTLSSNLAQGKGNAGKLLQDSSLYINLAATSVLLKNASQKAEHMMSSLSTFSDGLNKKGTLAHELISDTTIIPSIRSSAQNLKEVSDTASSLMTNLNSASRNKNSTLGVLLYDEDAGNHMKSIIAHMDTSSQNLNEDLKAAQQNFLLRKYFKNKK
ncbi:MAG: MlaD family protein [Bacteroidota bacterium]